MPKTLTLTIDDKLAESLAFLVEHSDQTLEELHLEALQLFVKEEVPNLEGILEAEEDIAAGRVIPHEEVEAWLASLKTDNPLPVPVPAVERMRRAS